MRPRAGRHAGRAAPVGGGRRWRLRSGLRIPLMIWPYLGLIGGTLLIAGAGDGSLRRLWWLAPAAALLYGVVLSLTVTSIAGRRRRERARSSELELLAMRLHEAAGSTAASRRLALQPLLKHVRHVKLACARLSPGEATLIRATLIELDAHAAVQGQLRRTHAKRRRADALFTLGWLGDERALPALSDALEGPDADLAYVAGQALAELDSERACQCLVSALQTGSLPRPLVATLLEGSRFAGWPAVVAAVADHPERRVRSWAAYLLGRGSDPRAGIWLVRLAGDGDAYVRSSAAQAMAAFPDARILSALLVDEDWQVRANAAKAIGSAGLGELASELAGLLADRVWSVRQGATIALKQLGRPAVSHLRGLLWHDDRFVRNKAAEILIDVGFVAEQVAALRGTPRQVADAREALAAVIRAEARETLRGSLAAADPVTHARLAALLDEVDGAGPGAGGSGGAESGAVAPARAAA